MWRDIRKFSAEFGLKIRFCSFLRFKLGCGKGRMGPRSMLAYGDAYSGRVGRNDSASNDFHTSKCIVVDEQGSVQVGPVYRGR